MFVLQKKKKKEKTIQVLHSSHYHVCCTEKKFKEVETKYGDDGETIACVLAISEN